MVACTHLWTGEGQLGVWQERIRKTDQAYSGGEVHRQNTSVVSYSRNFHVSGWFTYQQQQLQRR